MPVFLLDETLRFPNPYFGDTSGLCAIGGDLSPQRLILAYSQGFFPWFSFKDGDLPRWYCPIDRFVIFPEEIHISHSLKTLINSGKYECSFNRAFEAVIRMCSEVDGRNKMEGAWLGEDIIEAYTTMHRLGFAASVEVWKLPEEGVNDFRVLAGGLYGIHLGKGFFGESMASRMPNASKLALVFLARICGTKGWQLIDCQFETPHLLSMGGRHIPYNSYLELIR